MILRALSLQIKSYDPKEEFVLIYIKMAQRGQREGGKGWVDRQKVRIGEWGGGVGNICNSVNLKNKMAQRNFFKFSVVTF